jgi:Mg-chelatase subunit ChlD
VVFSYDVSGIVKVEAFDCKSGSALASERLPYEEPDATQVGRARVRPRWVIFAVDTSYSMQGAKIKSAIQGVIDNARALLAVGGDGCKIGVVAFSAQAEVACTPTSDLAVIERAATGLKPQSTTAMDLGIREAIRLAMSAPAGTDRDIVVLTDGMPDAERRSQTLDASKECASQGITLSSLGVGKEDVDLGFLNQLTPLALVIDSAGETGSAMTSLLAQSAAARGGLTDTY